MLCDSCKAKTANVFFTQIINGQMQKVNLCEECSKQKGVTDPMGFVFKDLLVGMGETSVIAPPLKAAELTCESCGFTHSDFKKAGRLGCPHCYEVFQADIAPLVKNIHKGIAHVGKVPARASAQHTGRRIDELKSELTKAIDSENYEEAARLRDEINRLAQPVVPTAR